VNGVTQLAIRDFRHVMEEDSINILKLFLSPWIAYDLRVSDYGIDIFVRISEINEPVSPDTFHIQLKSTNQISRSGNTISYSIKTKNLLTFEPMYEPVFVCLCDLSSKKLYWVDAHQEISRLNREKENWREQETNTIYFQLPDAEYTQDKLKEIVIVARKRLLIEQLSQFSEDPSFQQMMLQKEIDDLIEDTLSGKLKLKEHFYQDYVIANLKVIKIINTEPSKKDELVQEINEAVNLFEKVIKNKSKFSQYEIYLALQSKATLLFLLSYYQDKTQNINKAIEASKDSLSFIELSENPLEYYIQCLNIGIYYSMLYEMDSNKEYLKEQITFLSKIEQEVIPNEAYFISKLHLALAHTKLIEDSKDNLTKAIEINEKALELISFKENPHLFGIFNFELGRIYFQKAIKKREYIKNEAPIAINYLQESLKFYAPETDRWGYALIKLFLGKLYIALAEIENSLEKMKIALEHLSEALNIYQKEHSLENIADTQLELGIVYRGLYKFERESEHSKKSIIMFKDALEVWTVDKDPISYALIQKNFGMLYSNLAEVEETEENISKSVDFLNNALKVYSYESHPERFAATHVSLAEAYMILAEKMIDFKENFMKARNHLLKSLEIYTLDDYPYDYATAKLNLGCALLGLTSNEDGEQNCLIALSSLEESLTVFTIEAFPQDFAKVQLNLGTCFNILADFKERNSNLKKAISHYKESLKIRTIESNPLKYGKTNEYIGNTYGLLYEEEKEVEYLEKGIVHYSNALKVFTKGKFPLTFVILNYQISILYSKFPGIENQNGLLKKSIGHLVDALTTVISLNKEDLLEKILDLLIFSSGNYLKTKRSKKQCVYIIKLFQKLHKMVQGLENKDFVLKITNFLGIAHHIYGEIERNPKIIKLAIEYYESLLSLLKKKSVSYPRILYNIGFSYQSISKITGKNEDTKNALKYYQDSLKYLQEEKDSELIQRINQEIEELKRNST